MPRHIFSIVMLVTTVFGLVVSSTAESQTVELESQSIAIIGTGRVASAVGPKWASNGHKITYGSRTPGDARVQSLVETTGGNAKAVAIADAAVSSDIIVLAIPYPAAQDVVSSLGSLEGKIVIDPMNSAKFEDGLISPLTESISADIATWAPGARIVKALNTLGAQVMVNPNVVPEPVTVPIAGDDAAAKETVGALIRQLGLEVFDAGPLHNARYIDSMGLLYISANVFAGGGVRNEFRILSHTP